MRLLEVYLPVHDIVSGSLARIVRFGRAGGRCPADDFLSGTQPRMRKRFLGQFDALTKQGPNYCNSQRFTPLHGHGKPLWEFKEHDHRLYCSRQLYGNYLVVVLLSGWVKDKKGRTDKENREIQKALDVYSEFLAEFPGGNI